MSLSEMGSMAKILVKPERNHERSWQAGIQSTAIHMEPHWIRVRNSWRLKMLKIDIAGHKTVRIDVILGKKLSQLK